ncbi:hypothetical protein BTHI11S_06031 [Bosea thiooxidans]
MPAVQNAPLIALAEEEAALIRRAAAGEVQAIRQIIRTHNQRLYRLVRAVLRSNADAEEVLQEAYLKAFANLAGFNGEASLATWLSRIALNAALMRLRAEKRLKRASPPSAAEAEIIPFPFSTATTDPERIMAQRQLLHLVEEATDALPEAFRLVFVARVIEGLSWRRRRRCSTCRPPPSRRGSTAPASYPHPARGADRSGADRRLPLCPHPLRPVRPKPSSRARPERIAGTSAARRHPMPCQPKPADSPSARRRFR